MRGCASECGVASLLLQLHHDSPHELMSMFRNGWPCLCNFPSIHARLISSPDCLWKQWPLGLVSQHLFCLGDRPDLQNHGRCSYLLLILQNYITICFCGLWCRCCFVFQTWAATAAMPIRNARIASARAPSQPTVARFQILANKQASHLRCRHSRMHSHVETTKIFKNFISDWTCPCPWLLQACAT